VQQARSKRGRVKLDGLASTINPQLWLDTCHLSTVAAGADRTGIIPCRLVRSCRDGRGPGPPGGCIAGLGGN
jgi:hypothetical protein